MQWVKKFIYLFLYFMPPFLYGESQYILCIDGGGSKTLLQIVDERGELVSLIKDETKTNTVKSTASNIHTVGVEGIRSVLHNLFENVKIEKDNKDLIDILPSCQVVAGMTGLGLPKNKQIVSSLFEEWGISKDRIFVTSDAELALQLIDSEGIILISGTGSICFGKKDQVLFRVGGLGRILGDEGSGYQIGLQALKAALAEEYGWGPPTSLTPTLKEFFKENDLKNLIAQINQGKMLPSKIASSAPLVFEKAWEKDSIAEEIINQAADDLGRLLAIQLKISLLSNCEVHLWGGIFKSNYANDFIQKVIDHAACKDRNVKIINNSCKNPALLFACKWFLKK